MRRALALAFRRAGDTWPNPTVGAILVKEGRVIAEGAHRGAGHDHAEVVALRVAGERAEGSTLYVTLEPCHHTGRTGPCSLAIAQARVARVVYAVADTNPLLPGGGGAWLQSRGIELRSGVLSDLAWELNHPFFETEGGQRAHLTVKLAMSLDGRLARGKGPAPDAIARRITGEAAHHRVHRLRGRASVVLVGRRTAEFDRPRLDLRRGSARRQPQRAVIDPSLRWTPPSADETGRPWIIFCAEDADHRRRLRLESLGHELRPCARAANGELGGEEILSQLHESGRGQVLLEGGWDTVTHFLKRDLVDRLHLFIAPRLLGGEGPGPALWREAESPWERYLLRRAGEDAEWILRRPGLPVGPWPASS